MEGAAKYWMCNKELLTLGPGYKSFSGIQIARVSVVYLRVGVD